MNLLKPFKQPPKEPSRTSLPKEPSRTSLPKETSRTSQKRTSKPSQKEPPRISLPKKEPSKNLTSVDEHLETALHLLDEHGVVLLQVLSLGLFGEVLVDALHVGHDLGDLLVVGGGLDLKADLLEPVCEKGVRVSRVLREEVFW